MGVAVVVLIAASAVTYKFLSGPEVTVGPSPYRVTFISREDLMRKALINLDFLGRNFVFPEPALPSDLVFGPTEVSEDWIGVLYIEKEWNGSEVWEIDGIRVDSHVDTYLEKPIVIIKVPYAPSPEKRDLKLKLSDSESLEVRVPFREDKVPVQPNPVKAQAGPYLITANPEPRPFRGMDLNYTFKFEGPKRDAILTYEQESVGSGGTGSGAETLSTAEGTREYIQRGFLHRFKFKMHITREETIPVSIKKVKGATQIIGPDGKVVITAKNDKLHMRGYAGVIYEDEFLCLPENLTSPGEKQFKSREARVFKATATYEFEMTIDNSGP